MTPTSPSSKGLVFSALLALAGLAYLLFILFGDLGTDSPRSHAFMGAGIGSGMGFLGLALTAYEFKRRGFFPRFSQALLDLSFSACFLGSSTCFAVFFWMQLSHPTITGSLSYSGHPIPLDPTTNAAVDRFFFALLALFSSAAAGFCWWIFLRDLFRRFLAAPERPSASPS